MFSRTPAPRRTRLIGLMAATAATLVMAFGAASAEAIPLPGTPSERANTTTPLPPGGDQCSSSPDTIAGLVDFSYSCYGHDLCWQNNSYNGSPETESSCNQIFLDNMEKECDEQNTGFGSSIPQNACEGFAHDYYMVVSGISAVQDVGAPDGGSGGGGGSW
jgi:Prokaryotic phospholipase A2